ncbi:MAG TPA: aldehyde dehydrogenase family protein [Pseudomonadales bacterium]
MSNPYNAEARLYIDGELCDAASGRVYDNISPTTNQVIGVAADAGLADAERAVAAARRAFDESDWSTNIALRKKCLVQLRDGLKQVAGDLRQQVMAEVGAPIGIVENGPQCDGPIGFIDYFIDLLDNYEWKQDLPVHAGFGVPSKREIWKEAAGVVAAISPWNFPVQINLAKIVPALAAGCTVVLKSAPDTPWTATVLGRVAKEFTDMPAGVLNVLTSENPAEIGEFLCTDPRIDVVSFTGSTQVGRRIMELSSQTIKKVFLELGGKSAHIVLDDADFNSALLTSFAVCFHAGQGCAIPTRFLLPASRYDEGLEIIKNYFSCIAYGNPDDKGQLMGPLISRKQQQRVMAYIQQGIDEGARLVMGGKIPDHLPDGNYVEPTVFADVTNDMTIAQEEIFGPVLCVIKYQDDDDAVRIANDSIFGLSGSIYSASLDRALAIAHRIRTGTLNINGANFFAADAPFGGYKQSGIGREMGVLGFEEYLETKTVAIPA